MIQVAKLNIFLEILIQFSKKTKKNTPPQYKPLKKAKMDHK